MKGKRCSFAAFMYKLYGDVIIIRKMSSSRESIFLFLSRLLCSKRVYVIRLVFFQFILCSPESLRSLSLYFLVSFILPFSHITNGQFDKINEPRRHSVFALIMPYMLYAIVVKNNEMKINFLLPFFLFSTNVVVRCAMTFMIFLSRL